MRRLAWALLPGVVGVLVYLGALGHGFALDDIRLVRDNPRLDRVSWSAFGEPYWPEDAAAGLYRPLTVLSLAANRTWTGPEPGGFHAVNVLLHGLVCCLAWFVTRKAGVHYGTALGASLLFAVHPVHVEAVANIAGRAELLAALFVLGAWVAHRRAGCAPGRWTRIGWTAGAALLYLSGLLSKEGAVLAPLLFLLDDLLRGRDVATRPWPRLAAHGAALAAGLALRHAALSGFRGAETMVFLDNPPAFLGAPVRIATALWVQLKYLGLFVWPATLSSDYSHAVIPPVESATDPRGWAGGLFLLALVALLIVGWRRSRPVVLAATTWLLFFLPSSNLLFPAGTILGERLAYLPSLGGCLLVGHLLARLAVGRRRGAAGAAIAVGLLLGAGGALRTVTRVPVWRDNTTLALHDVKRVPQSAKLQAGAGLALSNQGNLDEAEEAFRRAVGIWPEYAQMHFNLGQLLLARGADGEALDHLERASELAPANPWPYRGLGILYARRGRHGDAVRAFERALRSEPTDAELAFRLAVALERAGRDEDAARLLRGLAGNPRSGAVGRLAAARIARREGRPGEAAERIEALRRERALPEELLDD